MVVSDWRDELARRIRGEARKDVPLAPRTSVRVGGAAELLIRPADTDDLVAVLAGARELGKPVHVLGGGANTIVGDGGVPGVVLRPVNEPGLERVDELDDEVRVELSAGAPSARLVQLAKTHRLLGAEWAAGIPGTVGGLTAMNAGTRAGEMKDCVSEVLLCGSDGARWVPVSELRYAYRFSALNGRVVSRVRLSFRRGSDEEVERSLAAMDADRAYRRNTQPLHLPNSGSVFRNPPGDHAGRLVEAAGLKGRILGAAQISEQHANFIVNRGGATAADVTGLLSLVRREVRERFGIPLALEVKLVGYFAPTLEALDLAVGREGGAGESTAVQ